MTYLTALLPVAQGVAAYAALARAAETARAAGDPRGKGQVMADALAAAVTGCDPHQRTSPATAVNLVMTDRTLFGTADDPGWVEGYGPVDADLARELAIGDRVWLRRLFADPDTGELVAMDAGTRRFRGGLRTLIRLRDQICRTPWCDAPIRHLDHPEPRARGGTTGYVNGQGLCEACNQAKETTGWTARPRPGPGHTITITTPTGHTYRSRAPAPPGFQTQLTRAEWSLLELTIAS